MEETDEEVGAANEPISTSQRPLVRLRCTFCNRAIFTTRTGVFRVHGPISNRCPGSGIALTSDAAAEDLNVAPGLSTNHHQQDTTGSHQLPSRCLVSVLKRIPRGSRECAAWKLVSILKLVVTNPEDLSAWSRLLNFPAYCLRRPRRGGHHRSLATQVNKIINAELPCPSSSTPPRRRHSASESIDALKAKVSAKLEVGDFRGAIRLASSDDTLADFSEETLTALQAKHPPASSEFSPPVADPEAMISFIHVSGAEIASAIKSFPSGSAGGPDGLCPQHLKDMTGPGSGEGGKALLRILAEFVNHILLGKSPVEIRPFFFGASLIALKKSCGGIRPIAIGCTLRCLAAKCAVNRLKQSASSLLAPHQLGFGTPKGMEAAVHAARIYLEHLQPGEVMLKLDFSNAFNCLSREKIFLAVNDLAPQLLPLVISSYGSPTSLFFGDAIIKSCEGVQQGDPLGPLLFCLTLFPILANLKSEFQVSYIDDLTLAGKFEDVVDDFYKISSSAEDLNLLINRGKSEVISKDPTALGNVLVEIPGLCVVDPASAILLGSPIGGSHGVDVVMRRKIESLEVLGERLCHFDSHDAFCLLTMPKLLHLLRSSPCFSSSFLEEFDDLQRKLLCKILNLSFDEMAWTQASLPVRSGGIGVRRAAQLAPSAFLASATACSDLINQLVPVRLHEMPCVWFESAFDAWNQLSKDRPPPCVPESAKQKSWDSPVVQCTFEALKDSAVSNASRARLLAAVQSESGLWLHSFPSSSLGLKLDNNSFRVAVGLRLGIQLVQPHLCQHCGSQVDAFATHGLSCRWSQGRFSRHASLNSVIKRSLDSAKIPSRLEPSSISRIDGRRPDGTSLIPYESGKLLVWDVTCPDTFSPSHVALAASDAGNVANDARG